MDKSTRNIFLSSGKFDKEKDYWLQKLGDEAAMAGFPADSRGGAGDFAVRDRLRVTVPEAAAHPVLTLSKRSEHGVFMILFACLNWLLHKYSGEEDLTVGMPVFQQKEPGELLNRLLALRTKVQPSLTFQELLMQAKTVISEANLHQNFPMEIVAELLSWQAQPLFQTIVRLTNIHHLDARQEQECEMLFSFAMTGDGLELEVCYNAARYRAESVQRIAGHLFRVIEQALGQPKEPLGQLELITAEEREQILGAFNDTTVPFPQDRTIHHLFEEQVQRTPERIAVRSEQAELTYRQLNEQANQLARALRERGCRPDQPVGVMVDRSAEMIIGILAVIKAGGAYLPINPEFAKERIAFMLEDSGAQVLLTLDRYREQADGFGGEVIDLGDPQYFAGDASDLEPVNESGDLLYIMYTSGSTGRPKGTLIEHRNASRLVIGTDFMEFSQDEQILQTGAIVFDATTFEIWGSLLHGGCLHLIEEAVLLDAQAFQQVLAERQITSLFLTTPLFTQLAEADAGLFAGVKNLLVGGDVMSTKVVNRVRHACPELRFVHVYGPTENTTFSTAFTVTEDYEDAIPIGRSIANSTAYIVDKQGQIQPVGLPGEIWVGGPGVARGYLNAPELTAEKFIPSPFGREERLYKTGDFGRWLPDGRIEFIGRIDHQVKIRGFRIELSEIENVILRHPDVQEAVVVALTDAMNQKYLCAYIVSEAGPVVPELRRHLQSELPEYMVPAHLVQLPKLPLTPNGKVDRRALPEPSLFDAAEREYVAPRNRLEEQVQSIWQEVLGVDQVGITESFFDLGGHSLKMTALVTKLRQALQTDVSIKDMFVLQTIEQQAEYLSTAKQASHEPILPVAERDAYPVSSAQKRLFILDQMTVEKSNYNIPVAFEVKGRLDRERAAAAWQALVDRQEALRTSFAMRDGEPVQVIHHGVQADVTWRKAAREEVEGLLGSFSRPFDLREVPLFRVQVMELAADEHLLLVDLHHIIADGVSLDILIREWAALYEGEELPPVRLQYKDYADWQNRLLASERMQEQAAYWLEQFAGEIPVLQLPVDAARPPVQQFAGQVLSFSADERLQAAVKKLVKETGTTMHMVLLAVFNVLLAKYSRQEDIVVGTPIAGRTHADAAEIVGMFVNTLAVRTAPAGSKPFRAYLEEVKAQSLQAYDHQEFPFEELVDRLKVRRDVSRNPLFDAMFSMQNMDLPNLETGSLTLTVREFPYRISKFDLTLFVSETEREIEFAFEYATLLFRKETMERMAGHFLRLLEAVAAEPERAIRELSLLTDAEQERIEVGFNRTEAVTPAEKTVIELFTEQAEKTPDNIAVVHRDTVLTYGELNERADRLARVLRAKGVGRDRVAGLLLERSAEVIVSILGIMKAGGAYLPIDPEMPAERVRYLLEDSGASVIVTQTSLLDKASGAVEIVDIEGMKGLEMTDLIAQSDQARPEDLAYVIYTSGSTGQPKGVLLEHRNLVNYVSWFSNAAELSPADKTALLSSYAFDLGYTSLFPALLSGCELHIVDKDVYSVPQTLLDYMGRHRISFIKATPSLFNLMLHASKDSWAASCQSLRLVVLGGEPMNAGDVGSFHRQHPHVRFFNHYGPTETCIGAVAGEVDFEQLGDGAPVPIGRPISNMRAYILDSAGKTVPVGVPGELFLGGAGLARSYLQRPDLTAEKFVSHPVTSERLYRTGDLARFLPDGRIEFHGRVDHQVKVRGYRVELGEIENILLQHPLIEEAALLVKDESQLIAYLVTSGDVTTPHVRDYMSRLVPEYMIPSQAVRLDAMPLTPNGKIDRKALPAAEGAVDWGDAYTAPQNDVEQSLSEIWATVLGIGGEIGTTHNFFEVGGNSITLIRMHALVEDRFPGAVAVTDLFAYPTIAKLADFIAKQRSDQDVQLTPIPFPAEYFAARGHGRASSFDFNIEGDLYENVSNIAPLLQISLTETMCSLFLYLLAELSEQPRIELQAALDSTAEMMPVALEVGALERIEALFETVHGQFTERDHPRYQLRDVPAMKLEKSAHDLLPAFAKRRAGVKYKADSDPFDLFLLMSEEPGRLRFACEYGPRLHKDKVREMIEQYMQVIESLTEHFTEATSRRTPL